MWEFLIYSTSSSDFPSSFDVNLSVVDAFLGKHTTNIEPRIRHSESGEQEERSKRKGNSCHKLTPEVNSIS